MYHIREKFKNIVDNHHFVELWPNLYTYDYFKFSDYGKKLESARVKTGEKDSVIVGIGRIAGCKCVIVMLNAGFMMGSVGLVAGEKIARAFRLATKRKLPVITFSASSGARIQEGIVSLVQMAKTSGAVYKHKKKKLLFISVICNPTLGGTTASFASLADIIIGEKGAVYGFTGRRIIEETTHEILPDDFQKVEYAKCCGMVDLIVEEKEIKNILGQLLLLHMK